MVKERSADFQQASQIAEHLNMETALPASEDRLQDILDNSTAIVTVKDLQLRYVLVNREYEQRFLIQRDQIYGKSDFDLHPGDVAEIVRTNDRQVIESGIPIQFELAIPFPDGERHFVVVKFLLRDRSGKPYGVCGVSTDVTELKRAEEFQARRARQAALRADIHAAFSVGAGKALTTMLQQSAEAIVRHLDAAFARIWTFNVHENVLELRASAGMYTNLDGEHARIAVGDLKIGLIARERKPHLTNDVFNDDRISHPEWARREGMQAFAGYPLLVEGRLVGVLAMFARKSLGQDTIEGLETVADTIAQNIERKRAERALHESEARFRIFFEHSADAMLLLDPQTFRYVEANEAAARLFGVTNRESLRGAGPGDRWPERQPDGRLSEEKARELVEIALRQGSHRFEWFTRRYDGSELPLDLVITPVPFVDRTLLSIVYRDISAQKRAESEIRQLNASLEKRVAERTAELMRSNDQLKRAKEDLRTRSEQLQKHRDVLLELAHSDKSNPDKALQMICSLSAVTLNVSRVSYWSVHEGESAISCEVLYLREKERFDQRSKGSRLGFTDYPAYFEELAENQPVVANDVREHPATAPLAENYLKSLGVSSLLDAPVWRCGEAIGVLRHEHVGPARNWTPEEIDFVIALASMVSLALEESHRSYSERLLRESEARLRESEARFSAAFRTNPGIMTISRLRDEKYIEVNDAFVRWYGFNREDIIAHDTKELATWVNPEDRAAFWADLRLHGRIRELECKFRTRWGMTGTMLVSAEIIEINGEPHVLAFGIDITQRKQAEVELLRALAKEKELGQLRSHFVSMISHEFRTPLGIIQSSAEILDDYLEQLEPAERKDHLHSICRNTRRMAGLMEEALLLGSLDAGKMEFRPAPLQLQPFLHRLVDEVSSATNRRCPIELSLTDMPPVIQVDERLLQHIFTNLLANAVKYSEPERTVRFEIECTRTEIVWVTRDQGIGIPQADLEWLFNPFHRGQNVADRPGTGLGLVIVKRCVDLHGGKIRVESQLGKGTSVTVRLPR
ncbi:MAG: PAS domain S-box protein [Verrucomicrobia bacterium]|nr:PAS domain S-box protein [Verrucomicrobiota bacterium]